eukprot:scaffold3100_cov248-Pinguiococcus_pyrenoidosus.AAC.10
MAAKEGVLVTCDVPVREVRQRSPVVPCFDAPAHVPLRAALQLIMHLDEEEHFVLEDLDDEHLLVAASSVPRIQEAVLKLMDANFTPPDEMRDEKLSKQKSSMLNKKRARK